MKICILTAGLPPYTGGAERRACQHARRLNQQNGVETILIGWERLPDRTKLTHQNPPTRIVRLRIDKTQGTGHFARLLNTFLHISEIFVKVGYLLFLLRHQYDLVHIFNAAPFFSLIPIPMAKMLRKPVLLEMTLLGSDDPLTLNRRANSSGSQMLPHRPLKYSLFLQADGYVSKSRGLTLAYQRAGLSDSKLFEIPSGIDTELFRPAAPAEKMNLRHKLGFDNEAIHILFVGGISDRKGVHLLIEAFQKVQTSHPEARLTLVGPTKRFDQQYVQSIKNKIQASSLKDKVSLIGPVANVADYLKAADIFVLPSYHEGFSMAILEAMSAGLPIVASDIPEIAYSQIDPEVEGILIPVADVDSLTVQLSRLINNKELRKQIGQAARKRVVRDFTHKIVDSLYLDAYRCLGEQSR